MTHEKQCSGKHKYVIWLLAAVIILLIIISFQMNSMHKTMHKTDAKVSALEELFDDLTGGAKPSAPPTQQVKAPSAPTLNIDMEELADDDAVKGNPDAPVTIVEFSDFECPFCIRFYEQTLPDIQKEYIDTGKVKFIYRDFPLGFHQNAQKAAEAAECAGDQGKYWKMHDKLFDEGVAGGVSSFKGFAEDLGLDTEKFDECLDSGEHELEVKDDIAAGQAAGITGTPGFLVNGKLITGAQPFSAFKKVIDEELAR